MTFQATKAQVFNRGIPPDAFLEALVKWGRSSPDEIFDWNTEPGDVYDAVFSELGPWPVPFRGPEWFLRRRAILLEVIRVLGGFESTWKWTEGRDVTNSSSGKPDTEEAGAWQVSANSELFGKDLRALVAAKVKDMDGDGDVDANDFRAAMKLDHPLAIEYVARLIRHTRRHNGPLYKGDERRIFPLNLRDEKQSIYPWLSREAVDEFERLIAD